MCMALDTVAAPADAPVPAAALVRVMRLLAAGPPRSGLAHRRHPGALGEGLPQGVVLRDLGEYHLRDIMRPVPIFQLLTLDTPAEFPRCSALAHHPTNVRLPPIPLIGREAERAAVAGLLQEGGVRLVTLIGPGGTGKTHLALQIAADVLDHFIHGVRLVSLAAVRDPGLVIPTIAEALGIKEEAGQALLDTLQYALRDQQLLLVLDNFEQVLAAGPQVRRLLATTFRVRVLATSRAPLGVYGEHELQVAPLQVPDIVRLPPLPALTEVPAVTLFAHYARLADPHFAVTPQNAAIVATLCARLDGLPLALRLAAAQIRQHDPPAILARLPQRLTFHNGTPALLPALPLRQQTLHDTITWSYDLLDPTEQALFRRVAVFSGPFSPSMVAALAGDGDWGLGSGATPHLRAALLSPPVPRPHGPGRTKPAASPAARRRRGPLLYAGDDPRVCVRAPARGGRGRPALSPPCRYLCGAGRAGRAGNARLRSTCWLARMEREHDNLRAAEAWLRQNDDWAGAGRLVGALRHFWVTRSHLSEGRQRLETVLTHAERLPPPVRAKVFHSAGVLAWTQGDNAAARRHFEAALVLRRAEGHQPGTAILLNNLGHLAILRGAYEEGEPLLNEAFALQEAIGDAWGSAHTLSNLGNVAMLRGDYPQAIALMEESLARRRALGDIHGIADSLSSLGDVLLLQGDSARADAVFRECLDSFQSPGGPIGDGRLLPGAGRSRGARGAARPRRPPGRGRRSVARGHRWA